MALWRAVQAKNIRSGWKNIFFVFSLAANDNSAPYGVCLVVSNSRLAWHVDACAPPAVRVAFQSTGNIFADHFELFHENAFVDGVNCLVEFACDRAYPGMAMEVSVLPAL